MKTLQIQIPLSLPEVPDEKDQCVETLIGRLQDTEGLDKVHVAGGTDSGIPNLCFHYDPEKISIDRVRSLVKQAGAEITEKIGHKLIEVAGIRHTRHARNIERNLQHMEGILEASVSASGMVRLEFDTTKTDESEILKALRKEGLDIPDTQVSAERFIGKTKTPEKTTKDKKEKEEKRAHEEGHERDHAHGAIFGKKTELIFSIICGALLGIGFGLSYVETTPSRMSLALYIGAYFFGGFFTAK